MGDQTPGNDASVRQFRFSELARVFQWSGNDQKNSLKSLKSPTIWKDLRSGDFVRKFTVIDSRSKFEVGEHGTAKIRIRFIHISFKYSLIIT